VINFVEKCIVGNYINFAICEYYNDNTFTQLSHSTMRAILNQDTNELKTYKKLNLKMYNFVEEFFKKHLEIVFLRFDFDMLLQLIN